MGKFVKVVMEYDIDHFETEVNEAIEEVQNRSDGCEEIIDIKYSTCTHGDAIHYSALLFFKDVDSKDCK